MRKYTLATFICIFFAVVAHAQEEGPRVVKKEPQMSDIYGVLDALHINLFRFDLSAFLTDVYNVNLYIDEYEKGKEPRRKRTVRLGKNIESLDEVPEEHRAAFRELKKVPEGKNEWNNITDISIYLTKPNDSTAMFTINVPDVMRTNQKVNLHSVGEHKMYFYNARPFTFKAMEEKDSLNIPFLLYGSGWVDERYGIIRFCGEREIDPDMKAEILSNIPYYYIVGIELKK